MTKGPERHAAQLSAVIYISVVYFRGELVGNAFEAHFTTCSFAYLGNVSCALFTTALLPETSVLIRTVGPLINRVTVLLLFYLAGILKFMLILYYRRSAHCTAYNYFILAFREPPNEILPATISF